jgi:UDP-N-acetylmuramoyl-L-alanyl-D-glutamate--2,6-diaminopimelate ligase
MRFSDLLVAAGLTPLRSDGDADVTDVVADSRRCRAGSCFVALRGTAADGHRFVDAALAAGASAVVCEEPPAAEAGAWAVVEDTHLAIGRLAQAIRGWPARKLTSVGITGTNGKSTVAHLVRAVLEGAGFSTGLLGTISYETGRRKIPADTTTPGPVALAELTAEMVADGRTHLVMEVSSHALDQGRTVGLDLAVGIFTNLSGDHLDYHHTMAEYLAAKRRLFEGLGPDAVAVINRDDAAGDQMAAATRARVCWYGLSPAADLWARIDRIDSAGTDFTLVREADRATGRTRLIGRHNVYNCLAAAAAGASLGVGLDTIADALSGVQCVPGRLERVDVDAAFEVFVDYAHTDDALANVLGALRPVTRGRLIVVFGCGGDRDRTKRPRMARVAEDVADEIIVTSDNPRGEEPAAIIEEILAGFSTRGRQAAAVEPDRRAAIELAVAKARPGDIVLIAGKGHENYQVLGDRRIHFDDVEEAAAAVGGRGGTG